MSQIDIPQFCGGINLPPTSESNPEDSNGIYHYQGCCQMYKTLMKESRKKEIMCRLYEFKINDWKCFHDKEFYAKKNADINKVYQEFIQSLPKDDDSPHPPPPLSIEFKFPDCCRFQFQNYIHYEISDALNDQETIEKFNKLYPDF